jgi:asparagine synthase (glutamine-hydrolysing)
MLYRAGFASFHASATPYSDALSLVDWEQIRYYDVAHKSLDLWQHTVLPSYILSILGDRSEMANSVEGRLPFLDHKLFDTLMRIPTQLKICGSTEKFVLRQAMKGRVHPSILSQPKMPFMAPPAILGNPKSPLRTYIGDTLNSIHLERQPFYCPTRTRALFDRAASMPGPEQLEADRILTFIASICVMQKTFDLSSAGGF